MKMKKKFLIAVLFILIISAIAFCGLKYAVNQIFDTDFIEKEAVVDLFLDNTSVFENSAEILSSNTGEDNAVVIHGFIESKWVSTVGRPENKYYDLNYGVRLVTPLSAKVSDKEVNEINKTDTWKIIKEFDFESISYGRDWAFFVNRENIGYSAGLLYYIGEMPEYVSRCEIEKITDNWYYCISE